MPDLEHTPGLADRLILVIEALLGEVCSRGWAGRLRAPLMWAFAQIMQRGIVSELQTLIAILAPLTEDGPSPATSGRPPPSRGDARVLMALAVGIDSRYLAFLVGQWYAPRPVARGYSALARGIVAFLGPVDFSSPNLGRLLRVHIVAK